MLMNRGTIASELRRFEEAAADLEAAALLAEDLGEAPVAFMARHNLGWIRFLRGDLPTALREMHDADALEVELDRSVARQDRARALLEAGLVGEAQPAEVGDLRADAVWLSRSPVVSLRLAGLLALATDAARRGETREARGILRRANATLVRAQLGLASLDLRTATALHGEAAAALDLDLAAPRGP